MRAALNSESIWVEPDILKLIKLDEADKFLIGHKVDNILPLVIKLQDILKNYL